MSYTHSTLSTGAREIVPPSVPSISASVLGISSETPTKSTQTADIFKDEFLTACGNRLQVNREGSMTVRRAGLPNREADTTLGPLRSTPHRTPPPPPRTIADCVTLAVEVGRAQT
ncbi:unnamed protein product [Phytophthora lilii]|uniref:Unnamed protein product n=1 Tax=Phytophthora lilii TaxID=2077276 RepID=A0A9W6TJ50_9STRA|nr:unnamed protein product [Phytophthora lilii]